MSDREGPDLLGSDAWEVPASEVVSFAPRQSRYAACVFVLDEGDRIAAQLERMRPLCELVDIVIADGGSRDGSVDPACLLPRGVNTLLIKRGPGRLSAQMRMAMAFALRRGYEGILVIDGNNKDDPSAIPSFVAALDGGCDHVQGSRYVPGGRAINTPRSRHLAVKLIHAPAIRMASGFPYTDTTNGFRAYSRRLLLDPRVAPFRDVFSGYELHYYLAIRAARLGYSVRELPVTRAYPPHGRTPTKIRGVKGNLRVLRTLADACLGRFDPAGAADASIAEEGGDGERADRAHGLRRRQPGPPSPVR